VNVPQSWLLEAVSVLRCRVGTLPILYMGGHVVLSFGR